MAGLPVPAEAYERLAAFLDGVFVSSEKGYAYQINPNQKYFDFRPALTAEAMAPLNWPGDRQGSRVENRQVVQADGFKEAYWQYVDGGWNSVPFPADYGGQSLPVTLATAVQEMVQSANLALSLCPLLTQGAIDAILAHASDDL
ncbi:MAG: hypothetical protein EBX65_06745, partial [Betaproteobacteria bacterium]|nr:hypothetical protein [Betaproteobacteria bacterium]